MKLNVLLRTCNKSENNPTMKRIVSVGRDELILRCLRSLITSMNAAGDRDIHLTIMDNSTPEFVEKMNTLLKTSVHPVQYFYKESNNNDSMRDCYEYAKEHFNDVILFAEDDYLYYPECLQEMIEAYELFTKNLDGGEAAIHPADSPLEYMPTYIRPSRIVLGRDRHWRTCVSGAFTLMLSKKAFTQHYQRFMDYSKFDGVKHHEASTINHMFVDSVYLFTPIPTLAYHIGYISPPAPHAPYEELWEKNA